MTQLSLSMSDRLRCKKSKRCIKIYLLGILTQYLYTSFLSSFYKWGNQGLEKVKSSHKVTELSFIEMEETVLKPEPDSLTTCLPTKLYWLLSEDGGNNDTCHLLKNSRVVMKPGAFKMGRTPVPASYYRRDPRQVSKHLSLRFSSLRWT